MTLTYTPGVSLHAQWYRNKHTTDKIDIKASNGELFGFMDVLVFSHSKLNMQKMHNSYQCEFSSNK